MHLDSESLVSHLLTLPIFRSDWVLFLLAGLSVVSIAVIFERLWFYRRRTIDANRVRDELSGHLEAGDLEQARRALSHRDALETNVLLAGLVAYPKGAASVEDLIRGELGREKARYERRLGFLATLASNSPYIGLFGTVLGIVRSFRDLSRDLSDASAAVMAGIAEALIATAVGLLVAIPAVVAFNVFKARVQHSITGCELLARVLLSHLRAAPTTEGGPR